MSKYAINNEGTISISEGIPNTFKVSDGAVIGGGSTLSKEEAKAMGFFPVVYPEGYNEKIHDLSQVFFSSNNQYYTYTFSNKTFSENLQDLKNVKIEQLNSKMFILLEPTDWYYTRKLEQGIEVPENITLNRQGIRDKKDVIENEILALNKKSDVVIYTINFD